MTECAALFDLVDVYDYVNYKFHTFCEIVVGIVDKFAPIKKFRLKKDSNVPWLEKELLHPKHSLVRKFWDFYMLVIKTKKFSFL